VRFLDLTTQEPVKEPHKLAIEKYDPTKDRERLRGYLAMTVVICTLLFPLVSFIALLLVIKWETLKDFYATFWPALTTLAGTALAFYFTSKKDD
jgi:cytochrome c oxidase subunit IV